MLVSGDRSNGTSRRSLSYEVIAAVAEREKVDPIQFEPPEYDALFTVVDPEALDALFAPCEDGTSRAHGRVEFVYCGYTVVVTSNGDVTVREAAAQE